MSSIREAVVVYNFLRGEKSLGRSLAVTDKEGSGVLKSFSTTGLDGNKEVDITEDMLSKEEIRDVFLRNGFTVKEGHEDLKDYVYTAAYELLLAQARRYTGHE